MRRFLHFLRFYVSFFRLLFPSLSLSFSILANMQIKKLENKSQAAQCMYNKYNIFQQLCAAGREYAAVDDETMTKCELTEKCIRSSCGQIFDVIVSLGRSSCWGFWGPDTVSVASLLPNLLRLHFGMFRRQLDRVPKESSTGRFNCFQAVSGGVGPNKPSPMWRRLVYCVCCVHANDVEPFDSRGLDAI